MHIDISTYRYIHAYIYPYIDLSVYGPIRLWIYQYIDLLICGSIRILRIKGLLTVIYRSVETVQMSICSIHLLLILRSTNTIYREVIPSIPVFHLQPYTWASLSPPWPLRTEPGSNPRRKWSRHCSCPRPRRTSRGRPRRGSAYPI